MEKDQKKAAETGATIVFADEAGIMMAPLLRRSWSPCGKTPIVRQRTRSHRKISTMGAVAMSPKGRRVRVFFRMLADKNFNADECVEFLRQLEQNIKGKIILVWDRLLAHRSRKVRRFVERRGCRIKIELLPAYAPELNPVEYLWGYQKGAAMANFAPKDLEHLHDTAKASLCRMRRDRDLVRRIISRSPLMDGFI
jgi:transposase